MEWFNSPTEKPIFWLCGMAGTGKSTVARTIAHDLAEQQRLTASFFFSRGRGDRSHAGKLLTTIALQMAAFSPALKYGIYEAVTEHDNILHQSMRDQWTKLIHQPLSKWKSNPGPPLILPVVIDALDECERPDDVGLLLRLLAEAKALKFVQLRVLVTSRPDIPINLGFANISGAIHEDFVLHDIAPSLVRHDIRVFLKHEMSKIQEQRSLGLDWPGERRLEILVETSGVLFIYAATVCRFIGDLKWLPDKRLDIVLKGNDARQYPTQRLDQMYTQVLRSSVFGDCDERDQQTLGQRFRDVVGQIVILFDSLSVIDLAVLLPEISESISIAVEPLKSVLKIPEDHHLPIQLLHPSFREFLLDHQRCQDGHFWIDQQKADLEMAEKCLRLMSNTLKRDICSVQKPGTPRNEIEPSRIQRFLPSPVQYASRYWVRHLQRSNRSFNTSQLYTFLQIHFLHWLEALSLIGKTFEAVQMITDLQSILDVSYSPKVLSQ